MAATTSIALTETPLISYVLRRADDALVLGHRLSEWCGHAPMLEEDIALANIALDLIGQARSLYDYAASVAGSGLTEDDFASGLYDDASVETWLVNWSDVAERLLLDIGSIGEIRRQDGSFVAEVRGLMHRFDGERGRLFRQLIAVKHCLR